MLRLIFMLIAAFPLLNFAMASDDLSVGIATTDISPAFEDNIPVGGYGGLARRSFPECLWTRKSCFKSFKRAKGTLDPIRAKAMYIQRPDKKLLFIGLDVIGVPHEFYSDILKKVYGQGFAPAEVIISATHTHSGPGALAQNKFWEIAAMGRFQKEFYDRVLGQIADTVQKAMDTARPADLYTLTFETEGLQNNRRAKDRAIDRNANLLLAQAKTGEWMGGLVNYAVHGTSLGMNNLFFSSDVPGAIEAEVEKLIDDMNGLVRLDSNAEIMFVQGAEGDVSPALSYRELGVEFAKQVGAHWDLKEPMEGNWSFKQQEIPLGKPMVNIKTCTGKKFPGLWWIGLSRYFPATTLITQVHFGNLWFLTWPGEPTSELGFRLAQAAKEAGAEKAWIFGLSNGYLSYFVSETEFEEGGYEACASFYGGAGANKIIESHKTLTKKMLR